MVIEIRPGGYRGHAASNHLVATGLSGALSQVGYVLRRVGMGQSFQRPAINLSLTPSPAVVESVDVPIDLRVEPYHSQSALNATVT